MAKGVLDPLEDAADFSHIRLGNIRPGNRHIDDLREREQAQRRRQPTKFHPIDRVAPNVYLWVPEMGSSPTNEKKSPRHAARSPLVTDPPVREARNVMPSMENMKY